MGCLPRASPPALAAAARPPPTRPSGQRQRDSYLRLQGLSSWPPQTQRTGMLLLATVAENEIVKDLHPVPRRRCPRFPIPRDHWQRRQNWRRWKGKKGMRRNCTKLNKAEKMRIILHPDLSNRAVFTCYSRSSHPLHRPAKPLPCPFASAVLPAPNPLLQSPWSWRTFSPKGTMKRAWETTCQRREEGWQRSHEFEKYLLFP